MKTEMSMKSEPQNPNRLSISSLVSGIIQDAITLISKEFTAARLEIREELDKAKSAALLLGLGAGALVVGTILLCFMVVHLIQTFTGFELWICYAIVGSTLTVVVIIFLYAAKRRAGSTSLVPARSVENAKEDARWITDRVK
jgi:uncharacterized membrane protein